MFLSRSFFDRLRLQVLFFTGSGSFSYKNRLKSSKKHVFAFTSLHRLRLRPKSTGSGSATLVLVQYGVHTGTVFRICTSFIRICICFYADPGSRKCPYASGSIKVKFEKLKKILLFQKMSKNATEMKKKCKK